MNRLCQKFDTVTYKYDLKNIIKSIKYIFYEYKIMSYAFEPKPIIRTLKLTVLL